MFPKRITLFLKRSECNFLNFARHMSSGLMGRPVRADTTFHQKYVRVSILGGDTPTGEPTALLLKQNPIVSQLYLYGGNKVSGIAADLKHVDTRCGVKAYFGKDGLPKAIRRADIIVILGLDKCPQNASIDVALRSEADRIVELAEACTRYCPKSLIVVSAHPIACTLPLVAAVFKRTHWYHPGRIIGSAALVQIRTNSLAARYQDLDPVSVHVPLVGGPDNDCVVPLFSRATPVPILPADCETLYDRIKLVDTLVPIKTTTNCKLQYSALSEAYGINQLITTLGVGVCGDETAVCTAFVRQNIIGTCRHLVTTLKFGPGGVVHNYGIPKLNKMELTNLEKATLLIAKREKMATDYMVQVEAREKRSRNTSEADFSPHGHMYGH